MDTLNTAGATRQTAAFVFQTGYEDLPPDAIEVAKRCFVDGTAVMLAGAAEPCAEIIRAYVKQAGGTPAAPTLGQGSMRAPAQLAALANGVAGHALDWDDTALSLEKDRSVLIHPTMQPLCACYALAEQAGASGKEVLTAFILGFEVGVKIAEAIHPDHFAGGRGFHTSGTIGVFGSAVAAAKLLKLNKEQITHTLAIAATMAAGLGVNHGTMSKPLNMGRASETGVTAAQLALLGFDGPANALEGGRGFFEAFGGGFDPERLVPRLGAPFAILNPGTSIKPYPSGVVGHPGMDAMLKLVTDHDISAENVESISVRTGENVVTPGPLRILHANTALEGKFCVPFQMAAIVLHRKAGLAEFSDGFVQSDGCQELQRKVTAEVCPEIAALGKDKVVFRITLRTRDGREFVQQSEEHYRGGPRNPLTWDALCRKFRDCADPTVAPRQQEQFLEAVRTIEELPDILPITKALTC
jgi:2-methylcitrate dehydratase PrpD